jgi:hypothetical protein
MSGFYAMPTTQPQKENNEKSLFTNDTNKKLGIAQDLEMLQNTYKRKLQT